MESLEVCLWFDHQAEEAARFYTSLFPKSKIDGSEKYGEAASEVSGQKKGSTMMTRFQIDNLTILGLNGGPQFKLNPSCSFFVYCESEPEIQSLWKKLSENGEVRMELEKYPWADKYGFVADRYGVNWQLILNGVKSDQKIVPAFLFVNDLVGKGEQAVNDYVRLFKNSKIETMTKDEKSNLVMHCSFYLNGQKFVLMEGTGVHAFKFNEAFSLVVNCEDQEEIDFFWNYFTREGKPSRCGWLADKYGVSWQIVPAQMDRLMNQSDPAKKEKVWKAMLQMNKLEIKTLEAAAT